MKRASFSAFAFAAYLAPLLASAQGLSGAGSGVTSGGGPSFANLVNGTIVPIIDQGIIPVLYALAFLFFLFGVVRFFFSTNEEVRKEGRAFAFWGIIGLVVLFGVWGIVRVLLSTLTSFSG